VFPLSFKRQNTPVCIADGTFLLDRSYLGIWQYPDHLQRHGIEVTFHSEHWPIEAHARALEDAGFLIEAIREPVGSRYSISRMRAG
jgi:hypothetical protein